MQTSLIILAIGALAIVALLLLVRPGRDVTVPDSQRVERLQTVPPVGDPMPVKRPPAGVDTAMPVLRPDTTGHAHLPASPAPRH
jgi:hypothetical protein